MFLFFNEENLKLPEMVITTEISSNFFKYMNLLMVEFYNFFFQNKLPKEIQLMKEDLQFAPDRKMGDWFLLEEHTIIRVYGKFRYNKKVED